MRTSSGTKFVQAAVVAAAAILVLVSSVRAGFISAVKGRRSAGFVVSTNNLQHAHHTHSMTSSKILRSLALNSKFDGGNEDIFLLSIDGTLASSTTSKSWMAVCAALKVWPALHSTFETLGMNPDVFDGTQNNIIELDESCEWLIQKLSALASISQHGNSPDAMLGCDAVLLSRLLLEEQLLDGGRSNGRGGKYGGKFHPSTSDDDVDTGERSKVGSRPLTVGELYANWDELRDVTRMKYPYIEQTPEGKPKMKDPLPEIRQQLYSLLAYDELQHKFLPSWQSLVYDILVDYSAQSNNERLNLRQNTMLLLGHSAQLPLALQSLAGLGYYLDVESDLEEMPDMARALGKGHSNDLIVKVIVTTPDKARERIDQGLVLIVPDSQNDETHSAMIERIVSDIYREGSEVSRNIFVAHSSIEVLKHCKSFLGDDAPILFQGLRKCILPQSNTAVTLLLPEWADNVHPTQQNDGEMDPWLNLISEELLLELISARILVA